MPRVTFRVDILCLAHARPCLVGRRYYTSMHEVLALFDNFTGNSECPWHSNESLIPRFAGPSSIEASLSDVEDSHASTNTLR